MVHTLELRPSSIWKFCARCAGMAIGVLEEDSQRHLVRHPQQQKTVLIASFS